MGRSDNPPAATPVWKSGAGEIVICRVQAMNHDGIADVEFQFNLPSELLQYGIKMEKWTSLLKELNAAIKYDWYPRAVYWTFLCCIPFFLDDHKKASFERGRATVEAWNTSGRLPKEIQARLVRTTNAVKAYGSGSRVGVENEKSLRLEFLVAS